MAFRFREESSKEFEKLGLRNFQWDEQHVQPPEGFPPIKTTSYPESVWDKALWPQSPSKNKSFITKGNAREKFLLTVKDLEDLVYLHVMVGLYMAKKFLYNQVERRAWEKYGGPTGLEAARKKKTGTPTPTKNGVVKGGLTGKGARAPASVARKRKPRATTPTSSVPSTSAAAPVLPMGEAIPSTPRKRGSLVRLHTQPALSTPPYPAQDNVAGPSTPTHARISARQSLSGASPALKTPTRSVSSQNQHDHRSSPSALAALDSFIAKSPTLSPVKRRRESEPGPSTPTRSQRRRLYISDDDDNDEPPPRTPSPLSSPVRRVAPHTSTLLSSPSKGKMHHTPKQLPSSVPYGKSKAQDDVLELTGSEEEDYVPMQLITPKKKSKGISPKKAPMVLCDDDVIEISE